MQKRIAILAVAALCLTGVVMVNSFADPALVIKDFDVCTNETNSHAVITNSQNGNTVFVCKGTLDNYTQQKAVKVQDPLECLFFLGLGATGQGVITPNGNFSIVCQNKI